MKFFINKKHNYDFDEFLNNNFLKYKNKSKNKALFYGLEWVLNDNLAKIKFENKLIKKKIFINNSIPCDLGNENFLEVIERQDYFDEIFSSCPYTSKFLNKDYKTTKYKYLPIPTYSETLFAKYNTRCSSKKFDVVFCGGVHSKEHTYMLKTIRKFKNIVMSYDNRLNRNFFKWPFFLNYQPFLPNKKKWDNFHNAKILIGTNLLYLNKKQIKNFKKIPNIKNFHNYDVVCQKKILPQMKTRMIEAASTKTLFLVKKDEWNVIENWFTPGKDFIYWTNYNDLYEKIFDITKNFNNYNNILDSAAKKVKQFYFEGFMKKILT